MAFVTLLLVACITFFLMNAIPGNPWLSEKTPSEATIQALNAKYGLDQPKYIQLGKYLKNLAQGDFGTSIKMQKNRPVIEIIKEMHRPSRLCLAERPLDKRRPPRLMAETDNVRPQDEVPRLSKRERFSCIFCPRIFIQQNDRRFFVMKRRAISCIVVIGRDLHEAGARFAAELREHSHKPRIHAIGEPWILLRLREARDGRRIDDDIRPRRAERPCKGIVIRKIEAKIRFSVRRRQKNAAWLP